MSVARGDMLTGLMERGLAYGLVMVDSSVARFCSEARQAQTEAVMTWTSNLLSGREGVRGRVACDSS